MSEKHLLEFLRNLAALFKREPEPNIDDEIVASLEDIQENISTIYQDYENNPAPAGGETLRELMMESLHLIHEGIENYLVFTEGFDVERLDEGLAMVEEGHDIMDSIRYAIEQDSSWTSPDAVR